MTNPSLIERLSALLEKATPGYLITAEYVTEEIIECPVCEGAGEVDAKDYCNIDQKALGVQFYGIGDEFGIHEELWSAAIEALPELLSDLASLTERLAALESENAELLHQVASARIESMEDPDGAAQDADREAIMDCSTKDDPEGSLATEAADIVRELTEHCDRIIHAWDNRYAPEGIGAGIVVPLEVDAMRRAIRVVERLSKGTYILDFRNAFG